MDDPRSVLEFWLDELEPQDWYIADPEIDEEIRDTFGDLQKAASEGGLEHWIDGAAPTLAYLIVTDQFPRNLFRGKPEAFATDARARDAARKALAEGWDMEAPEPERQFFYLPFEHSEDLADQDLAVTLFSERMPETGAEGLVHAKAHRAIIARYGRFPFRNAALGRETTPEEQAFLDEGAYMAEVERQRVA